MKKTKATRKQVLKKKWLQVRMQNNGLTSVKVLKIKIFQYFQKEHQVGIYKTLQSLHAKPPSAFPFFKLYINSRETNSLKYQLNTTYNLKRV